MAGLGNPIRVVRRGAYVHLYSRISVEDEALCVCLSLSRQMDLAAPVPISSVQRYLLSAQNAFVSCTMTKSDTNWPIRPPTGQIAANWRICRKWKSSRRSRWWVLSPSSCAMACPDAALIGREPRRPTIPAAWHIAALVIAIRTLSFPLSRGLSAST